MAEQLQLQVWADSFKEGEWFLTNLAENYYKNQYSIEYRYNFQPIFHFHENNNLLFTASVFAAYRNWSPIPDQIKRILEYGKPDIILFDPQNKKVFFAIEETAAVPTGNQSLQRLERVVFAAEQGIPFVYLVSEYGMHKDGGVRRTSIWPTYLALRLSSQYHVISLTLLYGDAQHPEDYSIGTGVKDTIDLGNLLINEWLGFSDVSKKKQLIKNIIKKMGDFILDQYSEISPYLPGHSLLNDEGFQEAIIERMIK